MNELRISNFTCLNRLPFLKGMRVISLFTFIVVYRCSLLFSPCMDASIGMECVMPWPIPVMISSYFVFFSRSYLPSQLLLQLLVQLLLQQILLLFSRESSFENDRQRSCHLPPVRFRDRQGCVGAAVCHFRFCNRIVHIISHLFWIWIHDILRISSGQLVDRLCLLGCTMNDCPKTKCKKKI